MKYVDVQTVSDKREVKQHTDHYTGLGIVFNVNTLLIQ